MSNSQKFGAYCDEENKLRFYNCVPVKVQERKAGEVEEKEVDLPKDDVFGVALDEENKLHFYNCVPVKVQERKPVVDEKAIDLPKSDVFGVALDEENKLHFYNCAPIKQKKSKKSPPQHPIRKMFNRLLRQDTSTPSGSDLSLSSTDSAPLSKS